MSQVRIPFQDSGPRLECVYHCDISVALVSLSFLLPGKRVMSQICMTHGTLALISKSHVTHVSSTGVSFFPAPGKLSRVAYGWVMALIWMGRLTHISSTGVSFFPAPGILSGVAYGWVMALIWMSHVTHMNQSSHTYEWVMSHIWMSHVTHMNE